MAWTGLIQNYPLVPWIDEFAEYFEETWLDGQFPANNWNVFGAEGPRTNNNLEGWHNKMKKLSVRATQMYLSLLSFLSWSRLLLKWWYNS